MSKAVSKLVCCLSLGFCLLISLLLWGETSRARSASSYVGSDTCEPCHDDVAKAIADSAHGNLLESRDSAQHGCESCHGPGSAHVNGNGDASKIFRFPDASPETVRARCTECHATLMGEDSSHAKRSCLDCHSPHHYQQKKFILILGKEQLCQRCH